MKSTPYETRNYYLPGHPLNPIVVDGVPQEPVKHVGRKTVGGFVFTDGAMSLRLTDTKSNRQAKYLSNFFGVSSELVERVDVPARARTYSPKSEAEGVLGLVEDDAPTAGGSPSEGGGTPAPVAGSAPVLEAQRSDNRVNRKARGSSVATPTTLDPATRQRLLNNDEGLT